MEPLSEKHFNIVETAGMCTLAFLINEPEEGTNYCTLQKLDYTLPDANDPSKKTFYFKLDDESKTRDIILLTMGSERAFLNTAIVSNNQLHVSEKPTNITYKVLFSEENSDFKDLKYTPNFKRPVSIIDPEIPDEVRPVLYYDENANMVKAKVKLQSNKAYIALEIEAE